MKILCQLCLALSLATLMTGCQCVPATERYCDAVDRVADGPGNCGDRYYRPCLDVSRWGMWNGPACCRQNGCR